jgi:hypothetical protein
MGKMFENTSKKYCLLPYTLNLRKAKKKEDEELANPYAILRDLVERSELKLEPEEKGVIQELRNMQIGKSTIKINEHYTIFLCKENETFRFVDALFLTSNLLLSFKDILDSDRPSLVNREYTNIVENSLHTFYKSIEIIESQYNVPQLSDPTITVKLINEVTAVKNAIELWLDPYKENVDILNDSLPEFLITDHFAAAMSQVEQRPFFVGKYVNYRYYADDILPLIWCEIKICLDNGINTRICPYCGAVYICPKRTPYKHHCGFKECKNKYVQESNKARYGEHWESERKANRKSGKK